MRVEREAQHVSETEILRKNHQASRLRMLENCLIRTSAQSNVADVVDFKTLGAEAGRQ